MTHLIKQVIDVISKPPEKRYDAEIETIIPWLRRRTPVLQNQQEAVLKDILRNCEYQMASHDDIILCQGERGECMYVILRGSVSVYVDANMTGEDEGFPSPIPRSATTTSKDSASPEMRLGRDLDRRVLGKFIIKMESGKSFGEIALISEEATRNASIIVDNDCDFLVVGRTLFNRSLKAFEESKYERTKRFVRDHPYFAQWSQRFKRLLELSLRRELYPFESTIVKQGERIRGMYFIVKGETNVIVEPGRHRQQYKHLWPFEAGVDTYSIEFEWLRESRKNSILRQYENPAVIPTKPDHVKIRRKDGCGAVEKMRQEKIICMCNLSDGEIIGDVELCMNLKTYMQTVVCAADTEVFHLDMKTFERLVGRKNPSTVKKMKTHVIEKLESRMDILNSDQIPILSYLHHKLTERSLPSAKQLPPLKATKSLPDTDVQFQYLLARFREGRAPLLLPCVPGALYYKDLMEEKARIRENVRRRTTLSLAEKVRETRRAINRRKPRSRREICDSLREMAEEEMMLLEQKNSQDPDLFLESYRSDMNNSVSSDKPDVDMLHVHKPVKMKEPIGRSTPRQDKGTPLPSIKEDSTAERREVLETNKPKMLVVKDRTPLSKEPARTEPTVIAQNQNTDPQSSGPIEAPVATTELQPVEKTESRPTSKWDTTRAFVNDRIQQNRNAVFNNLDTEEYEDFETSDTTLSFLESRIRSFHIKYGDKPKVALKLPKLRRYKPDNQDENLVKPRPGGRVWMHKRHCRFSDSKIQVKGHEHIRHHMVTSLPEFRSIRQTQLVVNIMMGGSANKPS